MENKKKIILLSKDKESTEIISSCLDKYGYEIYPVTDDFLFCIEVLDTDFDAVITGYIPTVEETEKIKKYVIQKKIEGSFIMINPSLGKDGKINPYFDNSNLKKIKELCLFADIITPNYTEALLMSNLSYKEECDEKDVEGIIFKLNSFGMAHKIVIPSVKIKGRGICTVVSEFGEVELVDNKNEVAVSPEFHSKYTALILNELLSDKNITDGAKNII